MNKQRGSATLEMSILAPAVIAVLLLMIFVGRVTMARQSVESAAAASARAASLARNANEARTSAVTMATATLANQDVNCSSISATVDTSGFRIDVGQAASVTTEVTCTVALADLTLAGIPGSMTITSTGTSPLDTYRER